MCMGLIRVWRPFLVPAGMWLERLDHAVLCTPHRLKISAFLFLFFTPFFLFELHEFNVAKHKREQYVHSVCHVLSLDVEEPSAAHTNAVYTAHVSVSYEPLEGTTYTAVVILQSTVREYFDQKFRVGQERECWYNPADKNEVVFEFRFFLSFVIFLVFSAALALSPCLALGVVLCARRVRAVVRAAKPHAAPVVRHRDEFTPLTAGAGGEAEAVAVLEMQPPATRDGHF